MLPAWGRLLIHHRRMKMRQTRILPLRLEQHIHTGIDKTRYDSNRAIYTTLAETSAHPSLLGIFCAWAGLDALYLVTIHRNPR